MKTLKLVRNSQGKLDIVRNNRSAVVLDSDEDRVTVGEQRLEKAIRSNRNFFDPRYGIGANKYIGSKNMVLSLINDVERQDAFFRTTARNAGTAAIKRLNIEEITSSNGEIVIKIAAEMVGNKVIALEV